MHKYTIAAFGALLALVIGACAASPDVSRQLDSQADRITALEQQLELISESLAEMDPEATEGEPMEREGEHEGEHMEGSAFEIAVAQYVLDTAGFHDIEAALEETGQIDPTTLATVVRVKKILASTNWPHDLAESAEHFVEILAEFQTASENDDAEAATAASAMAHDQQHDLSASIDAWLDAEEAGHEHG